jgi:hypothetical protein
VSIQRTGVWLTARWLNERQQQQQHSMLPVSWVADEAETVMAWAAVAESASLGAVAGWVPRGGAA